MADLPATCPTCGKCQKSMLYCSKFPCGFKDRALAEALAVAPPAAVDLPRPDVSITNTADGKEHVVISRDGKAKTYAIEGATQSEKIKNVVKSVIGDRYTGEWLP